MAKEYRPTGITIIAVFYMIVTGCMLIVAGLMSAGFGLPQPVLRTALAARAPYMALAAVLPGALAFGLWTLQNWARMITIAFSVLLVLRVVTRLMLTGFLVGGILGFDKLPVMAAGLAIVVPVIISAIVTIYLLRPKVARAFMEAW